MKKLLIILLVLIGVALLAGAAGVMLSRGGGSVGGDSYLVWQVDEPIPDYDPPGALFSSLYGPRQSLAGLYRSFSRAREDDRVKGVVIHIRNASFGLATAQELRGLMFSLRRADKFVECYLETAGEGGNGTLAYYLATACRKITLAPAGDLNLLGLYADSLFLRGTLEKLKIEPQFDHVGQYKSAAEIYTRSEHSPESFRALSEILDSFYSQLLEAIAESRGLTSDQVSGLIDGAPYTAQEALSAGLVDEIAYPDEFLEEIKDREGWTSRQISVEEYEQRAPRGRGARIAVVFAQGTILRGQGGIDPWSNQRYLGSFDAAEMLAELRDSEVSAVILRIDSPGGSAQASDLILRSVALLADAKPVIVSMSDIAASGGYYIATGADHIVASPATLTGSIGVVGGKLVTREFQQELLGMSHDTLKRGANADLYSSLEPFTEAQVAQYKKLMQQVYDTFVRHVAKGRSMSDEEVLAVAEGRVWTGSQALEHGLVDQLGGLEEAVVLAREAAGIDSAQPIRLDYYPRPLGFFEQLAMAQPGLSTSELLRLAQSLSGGSRHLLEVPQELAALASPF